METRTLPELPAVGGLIARAAGQSALRKLRPVASDRLPERTLVVTDHEQDAARLAHYDRVCGFTLRDAVPATWLHVLTFPLQAALMAECDFPFSLAGLVHLTNDMTLHRPVSAGERLRLAVRGENLREHRRGDQFDLVGEVFIGDEVVWSGRSTYLSRRPDARAAAPAGGPGPRPERPALPSPSQVWRLPADLGRQYAAVSGDTNPLHLYPATARLFGFPRPIIHGMWTHARALAALGGRLPERYRAQVSFTKPILLPATVSFGTGEDGAFAVMNRDGSKPYLLGTVAAPGSG